MKPSSVLVSFRRKSSFAVTALISTFLVPILTSPVAMAFGGGSGNPFGNGSFYPNEGTFQATIRGVNLSGVAIFSTTSNGGGGGMFTVFSNGNTYIGNTNGAISGDTISASFEASLPGSGTGTSTSTISSVFGKTASTFTSGGTNSTTTSATTGAQTNSTTGQTNSTANTSTNTVTTGAQTNSTSGQTNSTANTSTNTVSTGAQTKTTSGTTTTGAQTNQTIPYGPTGTGNIDPVTGLPALSNNVEITGAQTNTTATSTDTGAQTNTTVNDTGTSTVTGPTSTVTGAQSNTTVNDTGTSTVTGPTTTVTGEQTTTNTSTTVTPDQTTDTYGLINTVATSKYNDVLYASGSFSATLAKTYPVQQFKGKGTMTFQTVDTSGAVPTLASNTVAINVNGVRTSNTAGTYNPATVQVPYVYTTYQVQVN